MVEYRDDEREQAQDFPILTDDEGDSEPQDHDLHYRTDSESSDPSTRPLLPVWMRESAKSFGYRWVPLPLRKAGRIITAWVNGPKPPRELEIKPWFPRMQEAPIKLLDKYIPKRKHRACLLIVYYAAWFLTWSLMLKHNATSGRIVGYDERPSNLWCGASFWNEDNGCGLNGNNCRPFSSAHMAFKCPANCKDTHLLEDRVVGNQSLIYQGLVVGGRDPDRPDSIPIYRADSFICQAAIHAGVVTNAEGGCGVATLTGSHTNFISSKAHGIESTSFPATFPRSYTFQNLSSSQTQCPKDSRWGLFAVTAVALVILSLFTTSPAVFFFSTFFMTILHVGLVSDPPNGPNFYELISTLFSRLLPATFIIFVEYWICAVPLLTGLTAQFEKTILYLGFCFIGALNNYTFAPLIPIERLTPHDLRQPGARTALGLIITAIIAIVVGQIHWIRISGNMPKYLKIYIAMGVSLLILLALPGLRLRIHHYILALFFMPGTAFKTRTGLIYQGLLLGLFINGVARWGFSSIVQTPAALGERGSGGDGSGSWWGAKAPNVTAFVAPDISNITFNWGGLPEHLHIEGVSILINDVERWRGYVDEELYWDQDEVTIPRRKREAQEPEFFRFAWLKGSGTGLYSNVGIWDEKGVWHSHPEHWAERAKNASVTLNEL